MRTSNDRRTFPARALEALGSESDRHTWLMIDGSRGGRYLGIPPNRHEFDGRSGRARVQSRSPAAAALSQIQQPAGQLHAQSDVRFLSLHPRISLATLQTVAIAEH